MLFCFDFVILFVVGVVYIKIRVEEKYKGKIFRESTYCDLDEKVIQKLNKREQLFDAVNHVYYDLEHYNFEKRFLKLVYKYKETEMILNLYINFVNRIVYFIDENENVIASSTLENNEYRNFIHSYICHRSKCFKSMEKQALTR